MIGSLLLLAQSLYEEDPFATMKRREDNWREMQRAAQAMDANRGLLRQRLGYPPPLATTAPAPPKCERMGEDRIATYERCTIAVAPGLELYGIYLVPRGLKGRAPLVISTHGGGGFPEMALFRNGSNYRDMIRGAAREGYVVWAPLLVQYPFGDRDRGTAIPATVRKDLDADFRAAGTSLMGVEVAKIVRALDSLALRAEPDMSRVAMIGLSYGGFTTLYTAAVEPRIRMAVASCSFDDREAAPGTPESGPPRELRWSDVAKLIAPRPLQVQSGVNDKLLPIESARAAAAKVGTPGFEFAEFDGGHEFNGELCWRFLRKHLAR